MTGWRGRRFVAGEKKGQVAWYVRASLATLRFLVDVRRNCNARRHIAIRELRKLLALDAAVPHGADDVDGKSDALPLAADAITYTLASSAPAFARSPFPSTRRDARIKRERVGAASDTLSASHATRLVVATSDDVRTPPHAASTHLADLLPDLERHETPTSYRGDTSTFDPNPTDIIDMTLLASLGTSEGVTRGGAAFFFPPTPQTSTLIKLEDEDATPYEFQPFV
jgi:hypothetical protein